MTSLFRFVTCLVTHFPAYFISPTFLFFPLFLCPFCIRISHIYFLSFFILSPAHPTLPPILVHAYVHCRVCANPLCRQGGFRQPLIELVHFASLASCLYLIYTSLPPSPLPPEYIYHSLDLGSSSSGVSLLFHCLSFSRFICNPIVHSLSFMHHLHVSFSPISSP